MTYAEKLEDLQNGADLKSRAFINLLKENGTNNSGQVEVAHMEWQQAETAYTQCLDLIKDRPVRMHETCITDILD